METILLLDVGNTNVKIGLARPGLGLVASYALPTGQAAGLDTSDAWGLKLLDICRVENVSPGQVAAIVASSVVPPMNPVLARAAARFFGRKVRFAPGEGPCGLPLPIENRYSRPAEVGADRLVTSFAARELSDAPALVVVDFGTATTFDCVLDGAFMLQAASTLEGVVGVVGGASHELASQIGVSSRGTDEQSARVAETATAMEEMNATVLEVAKNAGEAAESSDRARARAEEGQRIVAQVVEGIGAISTVSVALRDDMNKVVADLEAAYARVRTVAAPANNMRLAGPLGLKNPCIEDGRCHNCRSETKICNVWTVIEGSSVKDRIHVLLVGEDLGY